jgi:nucleotide-binding universal stress UspA family protein
MDTPTGPIVVGVDESPTARRAAFSAASLATALGAPLHLVMAVKKGPTQTVSGGGSEQWNINWLTTAEQFLDALIGELATPRTTRTISVSEPATAICDEAHRLDARMIIVGNRRVQGLSRVLGAVATDVARTARCDVMIVNTTES